VKTAGIIGGGEVGRIRIGIPRRIAAGFLTELQDRYRQRWPGIDIELFDGRARDAILKIREAELDVAFVAGMTDIPDCHAKHLWTESLVIAAPESDPRANCSALSWRNFADDLFLVRYGGTGRRRKIISCAGLRSMAFSRTCSVVTWTAACSCQWSQQIMG